MVSIGASPLFIALTQMASTLPFFLFALPAGAIGDIVDRRTLILYTETWMLAVAIAIAAMTIGGLMTPWILLALTFALSAGDAVESPTWRAVLPELVRKGYLAAASALNGIEFNIARAVGPALAGALTAAAGVGAAFLVNVISFVGVIVVVARWKRPSRTQTAPSETLPGATIAAIRSVRNVPITRAVMLRSGVVLLFASAPFALLPAIAHAVSGSAIGYGLPLGSFGAGGIGGVLVMQWARFEGIPEHHRDDDDAREQRCDAHVTILSPHAGSSRALAEDVTAGVPGAGPWLEALCHGHSSRYPARRPAAGGVRGCPQDRRQARRCRLSHSTAHPPTCHGPDP